MTGPSDWRRNLRLLLTMVVLGFAIHILLPQVGELGQALQALRAGRWRYLGLALVGSALTFVSGGWMVGAATRLRLPFTRTVLSQVAASFMATVTPAGLGWIAVTQTYLQRSGADEHTAHAATTFNMVITFLSHLGLLAVLLPFLPTLSLPPITLPDTQVVVEITVATMVVIGVALWIPASRRRILTNLLGMMKAVPAVLGDPRRSGVMIAAAIASNLAFAVALAGSVAAYGPIPSLFGILVVYMVAATIAALSPTPGGLGAMEAALVAALVRLGVESGPAVAGALTFRLASFWLPLPFGVWALRQGRKNGWL